MASGIRVHEDCQKEFLSLKMSSKYHFIIFKLSDSMKEVVVEHAEPAQPGDEFAPVYRRFLERMHECKSKKESRFAVIDAAYTKDGKVKKKIVFVYYSPETASIKQKMVYSSTKDAMVKALGNSSIHVNHQANDDDDLSWDTVEKVLLDKDKYN